MWTAYTNIKASFENAGKPGHIYAGKWKYLSTENICAITSAYKIDGLSPSPQLSKKVHSWLKDITKGIEFTARNVVPNAEIQHNLSWYFFGC